MLKYFLFVFFSISLMSCRREDKKFITQQTPNITLKIPQDTRAKREGVLKWNRDELPDRILLSSSIIQYITKGHEPIDTALGDINGDSVPDFLLVTGIIAEDSLNVDKIINDRRIPFDSGKLKRQLLILTGQRDGSYKLGCRNLNAIPCLDCCGMTDPFGGISIKNGQITITEYCASNCKSVSEFSFNYSIQKKNWYLNKLVHESFCFDYQEYTCDTFQMKGNKKMPINKFDITKHNQ
jgi:hypothetical protein